MKVERILTDIQNIVCFEIIPARNIQIKKIISLKDMMELKQKLPF